MQGEQPDPQRGRLVGKQGQCLGGAGHRVVRVVERQHGMAERHQQPRPLVVGRVGGHLGELRRDQLAGPLGVTGGDQGVRRAAGQLGDVDVGVPAAAGEQLERHLVVAGRLVRPADRHRLVAGLDAGPEPRSRRSWAARACRASSAAVPRRAPLSRAPRVGARAAGPARRAAGRRRPPRPAARGGTRSRSSPTGTSTLLLDGRAQRPRRAGRRSSVDDAREQGVGDPPAGDAAARTTCRAGVVEPVEPHEQQVGEVGGQPSRPVASPAAPTSSSAKNALPSARSTIARSSASGSGRAGCRRAHQLAHVVVGRAGRAASRVHAGQPGPLGGGGAQRVAAVQVVGAVRRDDRDRRAKQRVNRKLSRSRVDWSAQCTSSTTTSSGAARGEVLEGGVDGLEEVGAVERSRPAHVRAAGHQPAGRAAAGEGRVGLGERGPGRRERRRRAARRPR